MKAKTALYFLLLTLHSASAQTSNLATIMVTGEKIPRSVFDSANSVSIQSAEQIEKAGGNSHIKALLQNSANVLASSSTGAPTIRGQDTQGPNYGAGAFFGGTVPRASINIDGQQSDYNALYFGHFGSWDVQRIEVFRGPQTTQFGANSIAGAIVVRTFDPTFLPEYAVKISAANAHRLEVGLMASDALTEELAARLALSYGKRDTFVDFVNPQFSPAPAKTGIEHANVRSKFLYLPQALPDLSIKLTLSHQKSEGPQQEIVNDPFEKRQNVAESLISWPIKTTAAIVNLDYHFNTAHQWHNQLTYSKNHSERLNNPMQNGSADVKKTDLSYESRWHFAYRQPQYRGFVGLFLQRTRGDELLNLSGKTVFDDKQQHRGLFFELDWQMAPRWLLTTGLRYQYDTIKRSGTTPFVPQKLDFEQHFDALLPKIALRYLIQPTWQLGLAASKGYNPGGVGLSFKQKSFVPFAPESVWDFALFSRATWWDERINLRANLFYSVYSDPQRNVVSTLPKSAGLVESLSVNAASARAYGSEWTLDWQWHPALQMHAAFGTLHTQIGSIERAVADLKGKAFAKAPQYTLNLAADLQISRQWQWHSSARAVGSYYSEDENRAEFKIAPYALFNTRVEFAPNPHVALFVYADNIFNKITPTWISRDARGHGLMANITKAREVGAGVSATW